MRSVVTGSRHRLVRTARQRLEQLEQPALDLLARKMVEAVNAVSLAELIPWVVAEMRTGDAEAAQRIQDACDEQLRSNGGWVWWEQLSRRYDRDTLTQKITDTRNKIGLVTNIETMIVDLLLRDPASPAITNAMAADALEQAAIERGILPAPKRPASQEPF